MINITDDRARRLWQQEMNRQIEVLEKPYIRKLTSLLKRQFRDASKYVSQGMLRDIDFAVDQTQKENLDLLKIHYRKIFTVFGKKAYGILDSLKFVSVPEMKTPMDEYWSQVNRWIEEEAASKIRNIQDTTKKTISSIVQSGMREQLSHRDIAKKIEKTSDTINPYRAKTIALTETHTGAVKAVDSAVKSARIEMEKEWVSSKDMRTRTRDKGSPFEHFKTFPNGADRERVPMDGKFVGTGQPMTLPGVGGSAGNVVRCRCVVLYHAVNREVITKPEGYEPEEMPWKPSMSEEEASQWVENSIFKGDVFHTTKLDSVEGIMKEGLKVTKGGTYGEGVYFTDVSSGMSTGYGDVTLRAKINVGKLATGEEYRGTLRQAYDKYAMEREGFPTDEGFRKWLKKQGYDGIIAERGNKANWIVVFDPKNVTVVKKSISLQEPMTVIGDLSKCIMGKKSFAWYEAKERPLGCNDYVREGKKWLYRGKEIEDEKELARLRKMGIPPAWSNVTASKDLAAKIQAIGQDKAGRWQYRYSAEHAGKAAVEKFDRVKSFSRDMAAIREGIEKGIKNRDPRAFLMEIENRTAIRVGSDVDFRAKKKAYGLTTLQNEHVAISGSRISLDFTAKEGIKAHYELEDRVLANWLKERKAKTSVGEKLFPDVPARKLNDYLSWLTGGKDYTIKDFRTYHATRIAHDELKIYAGKELSKKEKADIIKRVSEKVSGFLRNTPAMARNSYIDPMVWDFVGGL